MYCYVFFWPGKSEKFKNDVFANIGYEKWKKALEKIEKHCASHAHNIARMKCEDFMNQNTSISRKIANYSKEDQILYKIRLVGSLDIVGLFYKAR